MAFIVDMSIQNRGYCPGVFPSRIGYDARVNFSASTTHALRAMAWLAVQRRRRGGAGARPGAEAQDPAGLPLQGAGHAGPQRRAHRQPGRQGGIPAGPARKSHQAGRRGDALRGQAGEGRLPAPSRQAVPRVRSLLGAHVLERRERDLPGIPGEDHRRRHPGRATSEEGLHGTASDQRRDDSSGFQLARASRS